MRKISSFIKITFMLILRNKASMKNAGLIEKDRVGTKRLFPQETFAIFLIGLESANGQ